MSRVLSRAGAPALAVLVTGHWLATAVWSRAPLSSWSGDLINYFLPVYAVGFERLAQGDFPHWNPYNLAGLPWHATLQVAVFYPPHWLYALLPVHLAFAANQLLHLLLVALSMAAFARGQQLSRPAAGLAAMLFALLGINQWWLLFPPLLEAGAWLPLGALAVSRVAAGAGLPALVLLAAAAALSLLAGGTQVTAFLGYAWGTLFATLALTRRLPPAALAARTAHFAAALALAGLLAAVQLLPTLELTRESTRTTQALDQADVQYVEEGGAFFARRVVSGSRFSFGALGVALLPAAFLVRRQRALAGWALGLAAATWLLAVGGDSWAFAVYHRIPVLSWFRDPLKLFLLAQLGVALLAAVALDALCGAADEARSRRARLGRLAPLIAWAAAVALFAGWGGDGVAAGVALAIAALFALRLGPAVPRFPVGAASAALLALAACDIASASSPRGRLPYDREITAAYDRFDAAFERLAGLVGPDRLTWLPPRLQYEFKFNPRHRLRGLDDYEPLTLRRQKTFFDFLLYGTTDPRASGELFFGAILRHFDLPQEAARARVASVAARSRLLDLAASRHFLAVARPPRGEIAGGFVEAAGLLEIPSPDPYFRLYENPRALPRAFVTYRALAAPSETDRLLRRLSRPGFDPLRASFVEGEAAFEPAAGAPERGHPVALARDEETLVELDAELAALGLVVLADSFYRGWSAYLDGEPVPILAANHLFRGVVAPAGRHRIRFEYRPWGFRVGRVASLAGLALALALGAAAWRARRSEPQPA